MPQKIKTTTTAPKAALIIQDWACFLMKSSIRRDPLSPRISKILFESVQIDKEFFPWPTYPVGGDGLKGGAKDRGEISCTLAVFLVL
jgi:hypothetical protein